LTPVFTHQLEVRFRDCDSMGHVNNAVYLTYLEQARFHHWRASGIAESAIASPASADAAVPGDVPGVIVARVEIDYRRAAKHGDLLSIDVGVAAIGRTSFTYEYEILDQSGALIAAAKTVIVRFDHAAGRPVPISDELKQALTRDVRSVSG
jgi:acyl-CoA thioester hydrolase